MYNFLKLIRVSQWRKNFLIFLPFVMANDYSFFYIYQSIGGFFIFSFAASAVYIFNDLLDIEKDRIHPSKKFRPLASNLISKKTAIISLFFLFFISLILGGLKDVFFVLSMYFLLNILYTIIIKKIRYFDLLLLSSFYIIRIFFGGKLNQIEISLWLYVFCATAFLSLVILKRINEIKKYNIETNLYSEKDFKGLKQILFLSNFFSTFFLIFYLFSDKVLQIYSSHHFLWSLLPLYIFWILNINKAALLGKMADDPVSFVFKDKRSFVLILLMGFIILFAQFS